MNKPEAWRAKTTRRQQRGHSQRRLAEVQNGGSNHVKLYRTSRRLILTLTSIAAFIAFTLTLLLPIYFRGDAYVLLLSIDEYDQNAFISPVPFGLRDIDTLETALKEVAKSIYRNSIEPTGANLRQLPQQWRGIQPRDTAIAVLRGQTLVAPAEKTAANGDPNDAYLLPEDVDFADKDNDVPRNAVACKEIFNTISSSSAKTSLIILDTGDLKWDPRIGVIANIVPTQLDFDTAENGPSSRENNNCWIIGSNDTNESSNVSLEDSRGLFLRAVELAFIGHCDEKKWGGNGDGHVELHELTRFVATWTTHWAKQINVSQHVVLWKLGEGRQTLTSVPQGIRLVPNRLAHASGRDDATTSVVLRESDRNSEGTIENDENTSRQSEKIQAPDKVTKPDAQSLQQLWDTILEIDAQRPSPADYAPHLWSRVLKFAAIADSTPYSEEPASQKARSLQEELQEDCNLFLSNGSPNYKRREFEEIHLIREKLAPKLSQYPAKAMRRNRGLEKAKQAAAFSWQYSEETDLLGSAQKIIKMLQPQPPTDELDQMIEEELANIIDEADAVTESIEKRVRSGQPVPVSDLRAFLSSLLPNPEQRSRLRSLLSTGRDESVELLSPSGRPWLRLDDASTVAPDEDFRSLPLNFDVVKEKLQLMNNIWLSDIVGIGESGADVEYVAQVSSLVAKQLKNIPEEVTNPFTQRTDRLLRCVDPRDATKHFISISKVVEIFGAVKPQIKPLNDAPLRITMKLQYGGSQEERNADPGEISKEILLNVSPGEGTPVNALIAHNGGESVSLEAKILRLDNDAPSDGWSNLLSDLEAGRKLPSFAHEVREATSVEFSIAAGEEKPLSFPPATEAKESAAVVLARGNRVGLLCRSVAPEGTGELGSQNAVLPASSQAYESQYWLFPVALGVIHPREYMDASALWNEKSKEIVVTVEEKPLGLDIIAHKEKVITFSDISQGRDFIPTIRSKRIPSGSTQETLKAKWTGRGREAAFSVDVDGYPRVFNFLVDCRDLMDNKAQPPQLDRCEVTFLKPSVREAFRPAETIPLSLKIDAPPDAFPGGSVEIAICESKERAKTAWRPKLFLHAERDVRFNVQPSSSSPQSFSVIAYVSDWEVDMRTEGYENVDLLLEARLIAQDLPKRSVAQQKICIDNAPPQIVSAELIRSKGSKGDSVEIRVEIQDGDSSGQGASGLDRLQWWLDDVEQQDIKLAAEDPVFVLKKPLVLRLNSGSMSVGSHAISIRAIDAVGNESEIKNFRFNIGSRSN